MREWIVLAVACLLSITLSLSGCFSLAEASDTEDEVIRICRNAVVGEGISSDEPQTYQSSTQSYIMKNKQCNYEEMAGHSSRKRIYRRSFYFRDLY